MLTYHFSAAGGPLYLQLYDAVKKDIESGRLTGGEKMPSKRALAKNLGVSTITVENAYSQLIGEGFLYTVPKKGYYVSSLTPMPCLRRPAGRHAGRDGSGTDAGTAGIRTPERDEGISVRNGRADMGRIRHPGKDPEYWFDFSSNRTAAADFPFSVWARVMRETISMKEQELMEVSPCGGVRPLREAIAGHLASFRGMSVDPDQIIVGAGTEYLYTLLIRLLGQDRIYCIENPGYRKLPAIYQSSGAECRFADVDGKGMRIDQLRETGADIAHISPTHHFPTGVTMPVSRRYEMLAWADEADGRYIIEDDYDSEFRIKGRPVPSLQSIDAAGKVIYMNTFSKSLTSTIRISYMVLPPALAETFYRKLGFYSCTVSTFDQYALAAFIAQGFFEKHINRMRLAYGRRRSRVLGIIQSTFRETECSVVEHDSGLHMILRLHTDLPDAAVKERLLERGIHISGIADYDMRAESRYRHQFLINYSGMETGRLPEACRILREVCGWEIPPADARNTAYPGGRKETDRPGAGRTLAGREGEV